MDHNVIFFEILFYLSSKVKNKETFVSLKNEEIDFSERKFTKLCKKYFVKQCPLAHITKQAKFCNLSFVINKKVLSPRDITEQMVIDFISKHKNDQAAKLIDLCCGSGCIGITIKKNIPQFNVTCVDKY
ncbi:MAG: methyltransferase [Mycoplasmoidaceae bacterium]|nr:methyltransferase [Mycoplasmoidaceae bacterium]